MLENENLATEVVAEKAETPAEETPIYTQTEFDEKVKATVDESIGKKIARKEAKIRKEYERKYGNLEEVLKAGTGKEDVGEIADTFRDYYQSKGFNIPQKPEYSAKDIEILAKAEADEIIGLGFDEVVEEAERLKELGVSNMTAKDKAVFKTLAEHIKTTEQKRALSQIGVTEDVYNSQEFKDFASKFNPNIPIADIYDIYNKTQPKKEFKTMGSMKNSTSANDPADKVGEDERKFLNALWGR